MGEETNILNRIFVNLDELSSKQRKSVLGLIKDMGFTPEEIGEVVVLVSNQQREQAASTEAPAEVSGG